MSNYIVYNDSTGKILRSGSCPMSMLAIQAGPGETVIEGKLPDGTDDRTQKIKGDQVVDKTPAEIEADNPTPVPIPKEDKIKSVQNKDWDDLIGRIEKLETKE